MSQGSINPAAASLPATPGEAPAWLQAKKKKSPEGTTPPLPSAVAAAISGEHIAEAEKSWARRLLQYSLTAYGLSLLLHLLLVSSLSLVYYNRNSLPESLQLFGGIENGDGDTLGLDTVLSTIDDQPSAGLDMSPVEAVSLGATGFDPFASSGNTSQGTTENGEGDGGGGVAMPGVNVPSFAVTKGSFSVWTEPKDPKPNQNYHILIHIKLPKAQTVYPSNDLTGEVIGTDGFRLNIQKALKQVDTPARIKVKNEGVQVKVFVPGATSLVKDEIKVQSRLLKEKQTLEIEF